MIMEQKKRILAFLEKNPGASALKIHADVGIPEWTLRKLIGQLEEDKMIVKTRKGWKLIGGDDLVKAKAISPEQLADRYMREMVKSGLQK